MITSKDDVPAVAMAARSRDVDPGPYGAHSWELRHTMIVNQHEKEWLEIVTEYIENEELDLAPTYLEVLLATAEGGGPVVPVLTSVETAAFRITGKHEPSPDVSFGLSVHTNMGTTRATFVGGPPSNYRSCDHHVHPVHLCKLLFEFCRVWRTQWLEDGQHYAVSFAAFSDEESGGGVGLVGPDRWVIMDTRDLEAEIRHTHRFGPVWARGKAKEG